MPKIELKVKNTSLCMEADFIYKIENNVPSKLCQAIIKHFERCKDEHVKGHVGGVTNLNWKDSDEIAITNYPEWDNTVDKLESCMRRGLTEYIEEAHKFIDKRCGNDGDTDFVLHFSLGTFDPREVKYMISYITIQKIKRGSRYRWHNDHTSQTDSLSKRVNFIWYLNTLEPHEGGRTMFINGKSFRPKEGTLLFFPSTWTSIHSGELIASDAKYIAVGYINRISKPYKGV